METVNLLRFLYCYWGAHTHTHTGVSLSVQVTESWRFPLTWSVSVWFAHVCFISPPSVSSVRGQENGLDGTKTGGIAGRGTERGRRGRGRGRGGSATPSVQLIGTFPFTHTQHHVIVIAGYLERISGTMSWRVRGDLWPLASALPFSSTEYLPYVV